MLSLLERVGRRRRHFHMRMIVLGGFLLARLGLNPIGWRLNVID